MPPNCFLSPFLRQTTLNVSAYSFHPRSQCFQSLSSYQHPGPPLSSLVHSCRLSRRSRMHRGQADSNQALSGGSLRCERFEVEIIVSCWVNSFKKHKVFASSLKLVFECASPARPHDEDSNWLRARRRWHTGHQRWMQEGLVCFFFTLQVLDISSKCHDHLSGYSRTDLYKVTLVLLFLSVSG